MDYYAVVNDSLLGSGFCFYQNLYLYIFPNFTHFAFFLFYMHDKSYSRGLFLCIPIRKGS
ncbi:hypothetical protein DMI69_12330 [Escherichia coli]|nr:hypothetical protein [Escherichia coli]